jgi:hypothetical protein
LWWIGVFAGGFVEDRVFLWCFCGEVVVDCVANRGELVVTFAVRKMGQLFQLYF